MISAATVGCRSEVHPQNGNIPPRRRHPPSLPAKKNAGRSRQIRPVQITMTGLPHGDFPIDSAAADPLQAPVHQVLTDRHPVRRGRRHGFEGRLQSLPPALRQLHGSPQLGRHGDRRVLDERRKLGPETKTLLSPVTHPHQLRPGRPRDDLRGLDTHPELPADLVRRRSDHPKPPGKSVHRHLAAQSPPSPTLSPNPIGGLAAEPLRGPHKHFSEELEISLRRLPHRHRSSPQIDRSPFWTRIPELAAPVSARVVSLVGSGVVPRRPA